MKEKLKAKVLIGNLILIIAIIVYVTLFGKVFGSYDSLIGVCAITAMLMYVDIHLSLKMNEAILTTVISFVFMGIVIQLSYINPIFGFFINTTSIFIIMYLVTNRMDTKAFLPFILCYVFVQGTPIPWSDMSLRLLGLLAGGVCIALVYYFSHRKKDDSDHMNITEMIKTIDKNSLQFNFSLRMALSVSFAMLLGSILGVEKSMWISITAMSITQPHFNDTKVRVKERFFGTLIGATAFTIIFVFILPEKFSTVSLLVLSYIYTFINEYKIKMIFITMNALGASMILFEPEISIPMRIGFIVLGIGIAVIVNKVLYGKYEINLENEEIEKRALEKINY